MRLTNLLRAQTRVARQWGGLMTDRSVKWIETTTNVLVGSSKAVNPSVC